MLKKSDNRFSGWLLGCYWRYWVF